MHDRLRLLAATLAALVLHGTASHAQGRYRVLVGLEGQRAALLEFRPCVPAEGSDCGARVDRVVDLAADSSVHAPRIVDRVSSAGRTVAIVGGTIVVVPVGDEASHRAHRLQRDKTLTATALALSNDSQYVFVAYQSGAAAVPSEVRMIDLSTGTSIAHVVLPAQPGGVSLAP